MIVVYSTKHQEHRGRVELHQGRLVECHEHPGRVESVLAELEKCDFVSFEMPKPAARETLEVVHSAEYLNFLETAYDKWAKIHPGVDALPHTFSDRPGRSHAPRDIHAQLGYYGFDVGTPITSGTWLAATAAADAVLTAQALVASTTRAPACAFALTRPPGHHASRDRFGGYCYLNNAALAAEAFIRDGCGKVAVLDVDYHHGNGTQSIFYGRGDVMFVSIHADPEHAYPYYSGYADEVGVGEGRGANINLPLSPGTRWSAYLEALEQGLSAIDRFGAEAIVVSLGLDTGEDDPISDFQLTSADFFQLGLRLNTSRPTVLVLEGGYATETLGKNVVGVLQGYLAR